jgi:RHS repeat-associated protein
MLFARLRQDGQWFQLEAGLHYNWHRHYDPSLGRYTQPDPLGFVDGPSVYAYVKSTPQNLVDPKGLTTGAGEIAARLCLSSPAALTACVCAAAVTYFIFNKPPGYWDGPEGAEEWGRRNNVPPDEAKKIS